MPSIRHTLATVTLAGAMGLTAQSSVLANSPNVQPSADIERRQSLEKYALKLLNCNRTGGRIRKNGKCRARGTGKFSNWRKPLVRHHPIGNKVAWPWARTLTIEDTCKHELDGYPGVSQRYRDAGYDKATWGENIGCTWGYKPRAMVLWVSRAFQAEQSYGGGHWRNLKKRDFKSVGIGVAVSGSKARIVFDFYGRKP